MKATTKKLLALQGFLMAGALFVGQSAMAAQCTGEVGVGPGENGLLGDLAQAGQCDDTDKQYTYIASTGEPSILGTLLEISTIVFGDESNHIFNLKAPAFTDYPWAGTYTLTYSIEVLDPTRYFYAVGIDSDVPGSQPNVEITKEIFSDAALTNLVQTLNSDSGNPDFATLGGKLQKIWVQETFFVGGTEGGGLLLSATNTYTQRQIPEPGTIALFGLGLAALGYRRRARAA